MWGGLTWQSMAKDLVLGSPWYHLWFMFMMLALYIFIPPLRLLVRDARYRMCNSTALLPAPLRPALPPRCKPPGR